MPVSLLEYSTHDCRAVIIRPWQQRKFDAFDLANRPGDVNFAGALCPGFFYSNPLPETSHNQLGHRSLRYSTRVPVDLGIPWAA